MDKKRVLMFLIAIFLVSSFVCAENYKLEIKTSKAIFGAGENITLKVNLYDEANNLVNDKLNVTLEDAEKRVFKVETIDSNKLVEVDLGPEASSGIGKINAYYKGVVASSELIIELNELAEFSLEGNVLTIKNVGNTRYSKTIQLKIGETTGIKEPKLNIGESVSYILVAPEGTYDVSATDGKTTLTKGEVKLTGTGKAVGAIDEQATRGVSLTSGISPEDNEGILNYFKRNKFVYVFVLVILGSMILLAIERFYTKKKKYY